MCIKDIVFKHNYGLYSMVFKLSLTALMPGRSERDLPVTTSASCRRCFRNIFDLQQCGL